MINRWASLWNFPEIASRATDLVKSRCLDRRFFKARELQLAAEGHLRVEHIGTDDNTSDILTKPLPIDKFRKHRSTLPNLPDSQLLADGAVFDT